MAGDRKQFYQNTIFEIVTILIASIMKKYRHLQKGIEVVKAIGFKAAIGIYRRDPEKFRDMVVSASERSLKL